MVLLYHYTDRAGKNAIYAQQCIQATDTGDGLGTVVRFTELPHNTDKATLIANNWGTAVPSNAKHKLKFWFKFENTDLPAGTVKVTTLGTRNLWVCPVAVPLKPGSRDLQRRPSHRPRAAPMQSDANRTVLYHYTDQVGKDAIHSCGFIKAVKPHRGQGLGAFMQEGVYFTEIVPTAPKEDLIFNMYGSRDVVKHADWLERTRFWFKFDAKDIPGVKKRQTMKGRNEWVCGNDVQINWSTVRGERH